MLCHYGGSLILLDATYKTRKYSLFLFFLDIQTNVNYEVAAAFVTQEETFEILWQVLRVIKSIIFYSLFCISNTL